MTKTSQYCQVSARLISAIRQEKCRFHCANDHKSLWETEGGVGILGREERDGSYTKIRLWEDRAIQRDQHKPCAITRGWPRWFLKPVHFLVSRLRPSPPLWCPGRGMAVRQVVSAGAANYCECPAPRGVISEPGLSGSADYSGQ